MLGDWARTGARSSAASAPATAPRIVRRSVAGTRSGRIIMRTFLGSITSSPGKVAAGTTAGPSQQPRAGRHVVRPSAPRRSKRSEWGGAARRPSGKRALRAAGTLQPDLILANLDSYRIPG